MTATSIRPLQDGSPPWEWATLPEQVYRRLGGLTVHDPDGNWLVAALVDAMVEVQSWVDEVARDPDGWRVLLDPERCPWWALRWCGQVYGLNLLPRMDPWRRPEPGVVERWRREIAALVRWRRGTRRALIEAIAPYVVSDALVQVLERTALGVSGDQPYAVTVIVPLGNVRPEYVEGTAAASNLVPNPALSTGTAGWAARSAVLAQSTAHKGTGTHSLRVQAGSLTDPHAFSTVGLQPPGTVLSAGARVTLPPDATGPACAALRLEVGGLWPAAIVSDSVVLLPGQSATLQITGVVPPSPAWDELTVDYPTWADVVAEFDTWADLVAGFPTWADISDVAARLVLTAPTHVTTGSPLTGQALYWSDPHANVGGTLDAYGDGTRPAWTWAGTPHSSSSSKPDTRQTPRLKAAIRAAIPAGLLPHLEHIDPATWARAVAAHPTWADTIQHDPAWADLIDHLTED